ncbi:hypothetical protein AVL50_08275 [Flammeovirga sp. SJP92]|nr:hypothetical protein AVL50_08275 [Flammeovirga sp. SJP92]
MEVLAQENSSVILKKYEEHIIRVKLKKEKINAFTQLNNALSQQGTITTGDGELDQLNAKYGITKMKRVFPYSPKFEEKHRKYGLHLWYEFTFSTDESPENVALQFSTFSGFEISKPVNKKVLSKGNYSKVENSEVYSSTTQVSMNDPLLTSQWHYHNTGQNNGEVGADISLLDAWEINSGSSNVIVSVLDAGIDTDHIDLEENIWINEDEIPNNGIDDDGNGYIDDINGFNFVFNNNEIEAGEHGTHVAGTIAAVNNNNIGVAGVAGGNGTGNGVKLMSCMGFANNGANGGFAQSYVYAADNGAVISQNSWGHSSPSYFDQEILDAIDYFIAEAGSHPDSPMKGGIVIFAAGNSNDNDLYYPGYYEPILTVASSTNQDKKAYYSNYGDWVDITAPGGETISSAEKGVLSTLPNNTYGYFQGTSMACPHVSGVAALVVAAAKGNMTNSELRKILETSVDDIESENPLFIGELGTGRINALKALQSIKTIGVSPEEITFDINDNQPQSNKVTVFNISNTEVTFDLTENASYFTFDITNGTLGIDESIEITITFSPSGFEVGSYEEVILFDSEIDLSVQTRMNIYEAPVFYIDSTSIDFGEIYQGFTAKKQIEIFNNAFANLEISNIQTNTSSFLVAEENIIIPPFGNVFLPITFTSINTSDENGILSFSTNDPNHTNYSISLSGMINTIEPPSLVTPDSIQLKQAVSGNITEVFELQNNGSDDLMYGFQLEANTNKESDLTTAKESHYSQLQPQKGTEYTLRGREVLQHYGSSSDQFYHWTDHSIEGGIQYVWEDVSTKGTRFKLFNEGITSFQLTHFDFPFYSSSYNDITIFSNGYLQLGNSSTNHWYNQELPIAGQFTNLIAPYWTDLDSVEVFLLEKKDKLIVQYNAQYYNAPENHVKFQLVLHENGEINYFYHTIDKAYHGTAGISNETGVEGLTVAFNNSYLQSETAIQITPDYFEFTPTNGTIPPQEQTIIQLAYQSQLFFEAGDSIEHDLFIFSNDPLKPVSIFPFAIRFGDVVLNLSDTSIVDTSYIGNQYIQNIVIYNRGYNELLVTNLATDIEGVSFDETSFTVQSNDSMVLQLERYSEEIEKVEGHISFQTNDINQPSVNIPVVIDNIDYAELEINTAQLQFEGYFQRINGLKKSFEINSLRELPLEVKVEAESDDTTPWLYVNDSTTLSNFTLSGANASRQISVEVKENLPSGYYTGKVIVISNDPFQPKVEIEVELTVSPSPHLSVVDFIQFDQRYIDSTNVFLTEIQNTGDEDLIIHFDASSNQYFKVVNHSPLTLAPEEKETLEFHFSPVDENDIKENFSIGTNMPDILLYSIELIGKGIFERTLQVTENNTKYDIAYNESAIGQISFQNTSNSNATYKVVVNHKGTLTPLEAVYSVMSKNNLENTRTLNENEIITSQVIYKQNTTHNDGFNVLLLGSGKMEWLERSVDELYATSRFTSVTGINAFEYTPTLTEVEAFDVIVINGIYGYNDSNALGNVLYQYMERGGSIVLSAFVNLESTDQILGSWYENDLDPIDVTEEQLASKGNGLLENGSELLNGVDFFDTYNRIGIPSDKIKPNTEVLICYNDGVPFLLKKEVNNKNIYYINSYTAYWLEGADGGQLFANVIQEAYTVNACSNLSWFTSSIPFEGEIKAHQSIDFDYTVNENKKILGGEHSANFQVYVKEGAYDILKSSTAINVTVQATHFITIDSQFVLNNERQFKDISKRITLKNEGAGYFNIKQIITTSNDIVIDSTDIKANEIAPYSDYYLDITYTPNQLGNIKDSIIINGENDDEIVILIEGTVVPNGTLTFDQKFEINVEHNEIKTVAHTFTNPSEGPIDFKLSSYYVDEELIFSTVFQNEEPLLKEQYNASYSQQKEYGEGTDGKYIYVDSNEGEEVDYQWIDITSIGTELKLNDDDFYALHNTNWDFILYEKHFETILISSNGYLTFDKENGDAWKNHELPNSDKPHSLIAPLWCDLTPQVNGSIYYLLDEEKLIVQYTKIPTYDNANTENTFQLVYWKDGSIQYNYKQVETAIYTVGLESYSGSEGLTIAYNSSYLSSNMTINISPPKRNLAPEKTRFTLEAGESKEVSFLVNAENLFYKDSFEETIQITTSNPNQPSYNFDIDFNVKGGVHIKNALRDQTIELNDSVEINLDNFFYSSFENNVIDYTISSNENIATVIEGNILKISVLQFFETPQLITVFATKNGIVKQQTFDLHTYSTKPYIKKDFEARNQVVGKPFELNLNDYFGFQSIERVFSVEMENDQQLNYSINDSVLTITTFVIDEVQLKVIASNNNGEVAQELSIISFNNPPKGKVGDILMDIVKTESTYLIVPSNSYYDIDDHHLTYTLFIPSNDVIKVEKTETSDFKLLPLQKGTVTLIMTVDDGYEFIKDTIDVVIDGNYPPIQNFSIVDQTVIVERQSEININGLFTDPENVELIYNISTSNDNVLVELDNRNLIIDPLLEGETMVTIQATDGENTKETTFNVTITNTEVDILKEIEDTEMYLTDEGFQIDLNNFFIDADDHILNFSIEVTNEGVVDFTNLQKAEFTFYPLEIGETTLTVTASDNYSEISSTFNISVLNRAPMVISSIEHQVFYVSDLGLKIPLENYFEDEDQHPIVYKASLSNSKMANLNIENEQLEVIFNEAGNGTVIITAEDTYGANVIADFELTILEDTITSLDKNILKPLELNVYPNPVNDFVVIELNQTIDANSIRLFNASGIEVSNFTVKATIDAGVSRYTIDTQYIVDGFYFIKINLKEASSLVSKFIKK